MSSFHFPVGKEQPLRINGSSTATTKKDASTQKALNRRELTGQAGCSIKNGRSQQYSPGEVLSGPTSSTITEGLGQVLVSGQGWVGLT